MLLRYYYNWEHDCSSRERLLQGNNRRGALGITLVLFDFLVILFSPINWAIACLLEPLAGAVNPLIKAFLPVVELGLRALIKMEPLFNPVTSWMIDSVKQADPSIFNVSK